MKHCPSSFKDAVQHLREARAQSQALWIVTGVLIVPILLLYLYYWIQVWRMESDDEDGPNQKKKKKKKSQPTNDSLFDPEADYRVRRREPTASTIDPSESEEQPSEDQTHRVKVPVKQLRRIKLHICASVLFIVLFSYSFGLDPYLQQWYGMSPVICNGMAPLSFVCLTVSLLLIQRTFKEKLELSSQMNEHINPGSRVSKVPMLFIDAAHITLVFLDVKFEGKIHQYYIHFRGSKPPKFELCTLSGPWLILQELRGAAMVGLFLLINVFIVYVWVSQIKSMFVDRHMDRLRQRRADAQRGVLSVPSRSPSVSPRAKVVPLSVIPEGVQMDHLVPSSSRSAAPCSRTVTSSTEEKKPEESSEVILIKKKKPAKWLGTDLSTMPLPNSDETSGDITGIHPLNSSDTIVFDVPNECSMNSGTQPTKSSSSSGQSSSNSSVICTTITNNQRCLVHYPCQSHQRQGEQPRNIDEELSVKLSDFSLVEQKCVVVGLQHMRQSLLLLVLTTISVLLGLLMALHGLEQFLVFAMGGSTWCLWFFYGFNGDTQMWRHVRSSLNSVIDFFLALVVPIALEMEKERKALEEEEEAKKRARLKDIEEEEEDDFVPSVQRPTILFMDVYLKEHLQRLERCRPSHKKSAKLKECHKSDNHNRNVLVNHAGIGRTNPVLDGMTGIEGSLGAVTIAHSSGSNNSHSSFWMEAPEEPEFLHLKVEKPNESMDSNDRSVGKVPSEGEERQNISDDDLAVIPMD